MKQYFSTTLRTAGLLLVALSGSVSVLQAQEVAAGRCNAGWSSFGALGISGFTCDCTLSRTGNAATWSFRGEPVISTIDPGGPASGKLREGDVIVAINGLLITTRAAGEKIANLREGEKVVLTIRRNGRVQEVAILTEPDCAEPVAPVATARPPAVPAAPSTTAPRSERPPRTPRTPRPPTTTPAPEAMTPPAPPDPISAWFGFGISCHNCSVRPGRDGRVWEFSEYPTIYSVDPDSPAEKAGLRRGDILMKIDGADLLGAEGARRFGNVEPGQNVTWSFRRGGTTRTVSVTAAAPPGRPALEEIRTAIERMHVQQLAELDAELTHLRGNLTSTRIDSLRELQSARVDLHVQRLEETLANVERARQNTPAIAGSEEQHLRFAGMVGNSNVEVRGLSSVDVSYDNSTGELLIHTMDATIRVKAPPR